MLKLFYLLIFFLFVLFFVFCFVLFCQWNSFQCIRFGFCSASHNRITFLANTPSHSYSWFFLLILLFLSLFAWQIWCDSLGRENCCLITSARKKKFIINTVSNSKWIKWNCVENDVLKKDKTILGVTRPTVIYICRCLPPDRTWHKVNDYSGDLREGKVGHKPRLEPCWSELLIDPLSAMWI